MCCEEYVLHNDDDYELYGGNNVPLANENTRSNLTTEYWHRSNMYDENMSTTTKNRSRWVWLPAQFFSKEKKKKTQNKQTNKQINK